MRRARSTSRARGKARGKITPVRIPLLRAVPPPKHTINDQPTKALKNSGNYGVLWTKPTKTPKKWKEETSCDVFFFQIYT